MLELKFCPFWRPRQIGITYNRTMLELKYGLRLLVVIPVQAYNRTMLELKLLSSFSTNILNNLIIVQCLNWNGRRGFVTQPTVLAYNRTMLELKWWRIQNRTSQSGCLIIVQCLNWNKDRSWSGLKKRSLIIVQCLNWNQIQITGAETIQHPLIIVQCLNWN